MAQQEAVPQRLIRAHERTAIVVPRFRGPHVPPEVSQPSAQVVDHVAAVAWEISPIRGLSALGCAGIAMILIAKKNSPIVPSVLKTLRMVGATGEMMTG